MNNPLSLIYEKISNRNINIRQNVIDHIKSLETQNNQEAIKFYINNILTEQEIDHLIKQNFGNNITRASTALNKILQTINTLKKN